MKKLKEKQKRDKKKKKSNETKIKKPALIVIFAFFNKIFFEETFSPEINFAIINRSLNKTILKVLFASFFFDSLKTST